MLSVQELLALPVIPADHRRAYGPAAEQFGDLYLPAGTGPFPVVVLVHGGCWRATYQLDHASNLAAALARSGVAVWSLEYRRVGSEGGGWPGTFQDVARGLDYLQTLAAEFPLDLQRVVAAGHSAGGHLVLWLAARGRLPQESEVYVPPAVSLRGVVGLAPIPHLANALARGICGEMPAELMGGPPETQPVPYRQASPHMMLPLGVPQHLLVGEHDPIVPPDYVREYYEAAQAAGDEVELQVLPAAGHFELVHPASVAWLAVRQAVWRLVSG